MINFTHLEKLDRMDVMRAVAILSVFYFHYTLYLYPEALWYKNHLVLDFTDKPVEYALYTFLPTAYGWFGVQLFLVISGFLIHFSFLKSTKKFDYKAFIKRRFWRIYPPYLLAIIVFTAFTSNYIASYFFTTERGLFSLFLHVLLLHNFSDSTFYEINSSFWSLALEWQLYLIYPAFLWLRSKYGILRTVQGLLVLNLVYVGFLIVQNIDNFSSSALLFSVVPNWFIWGLGALLAENYWHGKRTFSIPGPVLFVCIATFFVGKYVFFWLYFCQLSAAILWAIILEKYLWSPRPKLNYLEKALIPLGVCSYSFYLIHQPIIGSLDGFLNTLGNAGQHRYMSMLDSFPVLLVVFLLSYSLHRWIEEPSIALGKRLGRSAKPVVKAPISISEGTAV